MLTEHSLLLNRVHHKRYTETSYLRLAACKRAGRQIYNGKGQHLSFFFFPHTRPEYYRRLNLAVQLQLQFVDTHERFYGYSNVTSLQSALLHVAVCEELRQQDILCLLIHL